MLRVSVGLPVHNGEPFLAEAIRSLLQQDLADLEIVISDNASTDSTEEICRKFAATDRRISYHRSEVNRGAAWNYNRVLGLASAPYFKWAASDDICAPQFLARCIDMLDSAGPSAVIAFPETCLIDADGAILGALVDDDLALECSDPTKRLTRLLTHRVEWHPVFGVMRTEVLRSTNGIGSFPSADIALLAEMAMRGRFLQVPEPLFLRRYHEQRSIAAGPSFVEQVAWYNPDRRVRFALPQTKLSVELLRAVMRAPMTKADRARSIAAVLRRWTLPHWRHIGGELKIALRTLSADAPAR